MPTRDAPSPPLRSVGTDIVDLADPRCAGKASDARFLDRVLTDAERRMVEAPADLADLVLWRLWALKEAAFKAITGALGTPPVFEHRAFEVRFAGAPAEAAGGAGEGGAAPAPIDAVVRWRDRSVRGRILETGRSGPVHALARVDGDGRSEPFLGEGTGTASRWSPERFRWGRALLADGEAGPVDRFTERERRSIHSAASAQVRLHARRDLAEWAAVAEGELEIVCDDGPAGRTPPSVFLRGARAPWSVGLSHHGRWLAWVLARL